MDAKAFVGGMGAEKRERNVRGMEEEKIHFTYLILPCVRAQSCPTLCCPIDCSLPDPFVHEISKQEYRSGLLFSSPGDLANPGIELVFPASPVLAGRFFTTEPPGKPIGSQELCLQKHFPLESAFIN